MPGRELRAGSLEASESPVLGSLKSHKVLPRRKIDLHEEKDGYASGRTRSPRHEADATEFTTSERIKSWIPEPTSIRVIPSVGPPLTPPLNFRDNFKSWIDDTALKNHHFPAHSNGIVDSSPIHNSPPTPDTTPPKIKAESPARGSIVSSRNVSDSRSQSFRTAHENLSSDDHGWAPGSPSLHPSRQRRLNNKAFESQRNIGLGLGLESEDDEPTPRRVTPELRKDSKDFIAFDGVWGGSTPSRINDQLQEHARRVKSEVTPLVDTDQSPQSSFVDQSSLNIGNSGSGQLLGVHDNVELDKQSSLTASIEKSAEHNDQPLSDRLKDLDAELQEASERRFSQASTNSTIVAAMVYDSPPQRRQTLRHTGRILDPTISGSSKYSHRNSIDSTNHPLRRGSRKVHSPEEGLRKSFIAGKQEKDERADRSGPIPLVIVPDRRSSLNSSLASSKRLSKTFSNTSRQQSSRPTTAPEEAISYFDMPRRDHRRTVSVVIQQARPLERDEKFSKELTPSSIIQISPPSVPTTSALSRTTSVLSGDMKTQHAPPTPPAQQSLSFPEPDNQPVHESSSDPTITGDWSGFRPRSAMVTPFSLRSAHSSTPGTLEVNEATALSIHPHTNKSILVIQEIASKDNTKPREQSAIIAGNASIAIPGALTPVIYQEPLARHLTDSPLQNPREPPQPPEFIKVIPPTPANVPQVAEESRQTDSPPRIKRRSAPLASIRRAFSARRYSESFKAPLTRTFSTRYIGGGRRFSFVENDERESRLHPSWQPRRHYQDEAYDSDSESEFGNDASLTPQQSLGQGRPTRTMSLTNRITGPFRKASLRYPRRASSTSETYRTSTQPLPYEVANDDIQRSQPLTRRLTNSLRLPRVRHPRRSSTASWSNQPHYEFVHAADIDRTSKYHDLVPGQGYPVQFVGFRSMLDKLEKRREMKEEGKREARRDWLRGKIDFVGPDDVEEKRHGMVIG